MGVPNSVHVFAEAYGIGQNGIVQFQYVLTNAFQSEFLKSGVGIVMCAYSSKTWEAKAGGLL